MTGPGTPGTRARARSVLAAAVLLFTAFPAILTGCAPDETTPSRAMATHRAGDVGAFIRVVSPEGAVKFGDDVTLVVRATRDGAPLVAQSATFEVLSGPAVYSGGFDSSVTDRDGVASSTGLHAEGAGTVTVRVTVGTISTALTVDVAAP